MSKITESQQNILIYIFLTGHPLGSTEIAETVGESMRTNPDANPRGSSWATPKCQSLKTKGLLEQTSDRKYSVTKKGAETAWHLLSERNCLCESSNGFLKTIQQEFEETYEGYTSYFHRLVNSIKSKFL